jgi:hypothetical protein
LLFILASALALAISGLAQASSYKSATSRADVFTFQNEDGSDAAGNVVGRAYLHRLEAGVSLVIKTRGLVPGHAYTVWWVIFNNPRKCGHDGCTDADFANPEVEASVLNATGRVALSSRVSFYAALPAGYIYTNPSSGNGRHLFGPGLQNVRGAEIHVVIKDHGDTTGSVEQISTFIGDCMLDPDITPGGCYDPQAAVFPLPRKKYGHH